ncbi:cytokine-induced anti-apoptosis inhibitor 1, Fe-S biogenesis-domain-containing protein [Scheffersomyces amazonensis]|uniref:cytokine-induced anti-apoptosis inhibitor 1, Fe-S biogenesis-domain-containing protein n=1 Tax=Scheffersomyces amazonensis TaxID=1078765 RepID=UPI00315C8619
MSRVLLLLHPTVVTDQHLVEQIKSQIASTHKNFALEQHIIDRVTRGDVELANNTYNEIVYVNPNDAAYQIIPASLMKLLYEVLTDEGVLSGDLPTDQNLDVLMTGFIVNDNKWVKPKPIEVVTLKKKSTTNSTAPLKKLPLFKKLDNSVGLTDTSADEEDTEETQAMKRKLDETKLTYFSDDDSENEDDEDDGIIDENDLIQESSNTGSSKLIVPRKCELPNGKRRRKACKDCTCGLKELEEAEENQQRSLQDSILGKMAQSATLEAIKIEERLKSKLNAVKFKDEDLAEIDFTVQGKTGGCGSCALGDAFRCDGCPYLGLPPFKPGEVITIDSLGEDF